jgi:protein-tyrosine phosphatase
MTNEQPARLLRWEACYNARDLGGYATADGGRTRWGAFVRADNLSRLTASGRTALLGYGVRTVIDLRRASELEIDPNPFAERTADATLPMYLNLPLGLGAESAGIAAVAAAGAGADAPMLALYRQVFDHYWRGIAGVMTAIAAAPEGAVLFHCHAGKDRTGLIAALLLALAGVPEPMIAEDYGLSQACLKPIYDERLNQEPDAEKRARLAQLINAAPETMLSLLEHLNMRHGGAERYLLAAGMAAGDLERLRRRVRA